MAQNAFHVLQSGVYFNTRYVFKDGSTWGVTHKEINDGLIDVTLDDGTMCDVTPAELHDWVSTNDLMPVCGICNKPVKGGALDSHLVAFHSVKVRG